MALRKRLQDTGEALRQTAAELIPGVRVELLSNREAVVDGCRGILEYNECCIRLSAERLVIRFRGEGLELRNYGESGAVVEGRITAVEFI